MAFVYEYLDEEEVVYVGKVANSSKESLMRRKSQHCTDPYCNFKFRYTELETHSEADSLETYLINKIRPKFNKAKINWGDANKFFDYYFKFNGIRWIDQRGNAYYENPSNSDEITKMKMIIVKLKKELDKKEKELSDVMNHINRKRIVKWLLKF